MPRLWIALASLLLGGGLATPVALAQESEDEEDEFEFDKDEGEADRPAPKPEDPKKADPKKTDPAAPAEPAPKKAPVNPEESDDLEFEDEVDDDLDPKAPAKETEKDPFLDDEEERDDAELLAPGTDNERLYRAQEDEVEGMPSDEEVMAWEAYLEKYPNSIYRKRIEDRVDALVEGQFRMRIDRDDDKGGDADDEELNFVNPLHMTNVNPRTRAFVALEFGFPTYTQLTADFEYAFLRNVSAHAGLYGRYTGWTFEAGVRAAPLKSTRLKMVGTFIADVGINFNQRVNTRQEGVDGDANRVFFQARPQFALGKIVGPAQLLFSVGTEIGSRKFSSPALIGGAHVGVRIAPPVGVFVETDFYVRNFSREGGPFHFEVLSFGFKFYPMQKRTDDPLEIAMGGHIPVAQSYFQPFLGAVQAQAAYYPDF